MSPDAVTCVCLTTYPARAAFLRDALVAYAGQAVAAKCLVVVNDGPAALRSSRGDVRVLNVAVGLSLGRRRQLGLDAVETAWFAPWDDDDFALPEHLATLRDAAAHARRPHASVGRAALAGPDLVPRVVVATQGRMPAPVVVATAAARRAGGYPDLARMVGADSAMLARCGPKLVVARTTYVHRRHDLNSIRRDPGGTADPTADPYDRALRQAVGRSPAAEVVALRARLAALRAAPTAVLVVPA